jgi:hypothetical protein
MGEEDETKTRYSPRVAVKCKSRTRAQNVSNGQKKQQKEQESRAAGVKNEAEASRPNVHDDEKDWIRRSSLCPENSTPDGAKTRQ